MSESNRVESNLSRFETNRTFFGPIRFDRIEQPLGSTRFDSIGALHRIFRLHNNDHRSKYGTQYARQGHVAVALRDGTIKRMGQHFTLSPLFESQTSLLDESLGHIYGRKDAARDICQRSFQSWSGSPNNPIIIGEDSVPTAVTRSESPQPQLDIYIGSSSPEQLRPQRAVSFGHADRRPRLIHCRLDGLAQTVCPCS